MQLDVLRRKAAEQSNPLAAELDRIIGLLVDETHRLREFMPKDCKQ
jgi:hypothetical protein